MPAVKTVTAVVPREPVACWRAFTDQSTLVAWVPGLRRAQIISLGPRGLAAEVHFEYADSLVYTLVYTYDREGYGFSWEPKLGKRDGVSGSVRFDPAEGGGTKMTYSLAHGDGRDDRERELGDPQALVDAFVAWITARR